MMTPHKLLSGTYAPTDVWTITIADDENSTAMIVCNEYALAFQNGVFCAVAVSEVANAVLPTLYGVEVTTGIDKVESQDKEVKGIYDLTGRKVEKITKSGIYVVDGKKRLVK
jgi:hypothetical protein